jgi:hypothetical protein
MPALAPPAEQQQRPERQRVPGHDPLQVSGGHTELPLDGGQRLTVMNVAFEQWVDDASRTPFRQLAREALAQLREIAAAG